MPIEIKELIIRASIRDDNDQSKKNNNSNSVSGGNHSQEERIVSRCVEQILNILRIQNER